MMSWVLTKFWILGVVLFVVLFQPEIRRVFFQTTERKKMGKGFFDEDILFDELIKGVNALSVNKFGALIVVERNTDLTPYIERGTKIEGDLSASLLVTIFTPTTPLHDGAVIIRDGRVVAAKCILPLSEWGDDLGTRHRSALGLSEHTDALIIVVSEETGEISIAINGGMARNLPIERLSEMLSLYLPKR
jgi:diadenylate cyclase